MSRRTYERMNIWLERPRTNEQTDRQTENRSKHKAPHTTGAQGHHHQPHQCHRTPLLPPIKPPHRSPLTNLGADKQTTLRTTIRTTIRTYKQTSKRDASPQKITHLTPCSIPNLTAAAKSTSTQAPVPPPTYPPHLIKKNAQTA